MMSSPTASSTLDDQPVILQALDKDWIAVAAAMVGLIFSVGTLTVYSFGVFALPLHMEFGWTATALSGALAVSQVGMAIASPLWGQLVDRIGPRPVLLFSTMAASLIIASMSMLAAPLWHIYLVFGALPLLAAASSPLGYSAVLIRLFDRHLGLALGLSAMGVGLGATIIPLLAQVLIANFGWRHAYLAIGVITFLTSSPAALICTRNVREPTHRSRPIVSIIPLLRTRSFITMCLMYFLLGLVTIGTVVQLVPIMIDRGFTATSAAHMAALTGLAALASRAVVGLVLDRLQALRVVAAIAFLTAFAVLMLASGNSFYRVLLGVILLGVSIGAEVSFIAYLTRRHFSGSAFGRLYGIALGMYVVGGGVGPLALGVSADRFGEYTTGLLLFAAVAAFAIPLAISIPQPNGRLREIR